MNEKLEALKHLIQKMGFKYKENKMKHGALIDLRICINGWGVAVHVSNGNIDDDNAFYKTFKRHYFPFFVREEETEEFILEKMTNLANKLCSMPTPEEAAKQAQEHKALRMAEQKARREARKATKRAKEAATLAASKPKRKRQRIIRYEKV